MQDGDIQHGCLELKRVISQLRLNLERGYFRFYGSIDPTESVKGALYRIWCGVSRLGDSGVKVV